MSKLPCPFRFDAQLRADGEYATCGLMQQVLRVSDSSVCEVPRAACEACCGTTLAASSFINGVFPSLLNAASARVAQCPELSSEHSRRLTSLIEITEKALVDELSIRRYRVPACDIFLCCTDATDATRRSIESILNQQQAVVNLHLILDTSAAEPLSEQFEHAWNVHFHRSARPAGLWRALHALVPSARTEFIAVQEAGAISLHNRIANAVGELERTGGDFIGSAMSTEAAEIQARCPDATYCAWIPWPTLVFRRSTFIDLGGIAERESDQAAELLHRAQQSKASIDVLPFATVQYAGVWKEPPMGPRPNYSEPLKSLRNYAIGYEYQPVQCDVVLPIYRNLSYARLALESVIEQQAAQAIVHLIDDCSPEDTTQLFEFWGSHPRVRLYRNVKNIGQYASFNNAAEFFETEYVAVQDADDISLPQRLHSSVNFLRLCDADYYGGAMQTFGDAALVEHLHPDLRHRKSFVPHGGAGLYFMMNPTACFRTSMFRRLGGYSDFGGPKFNIGLDTEFMTRAYHAGVRFACSTETVTKYRVHNQSATRSTETGFGSQRREIVFQECRRRQSLYHGSGFDPKAFGAIGRYRGMTRRVSPST